MNSSETLRLLEWNVQSGGFEGYDEFAASPKYLPEIIHSVSAIDAQFVVLIDTFRWHSLFTRDHLADMFGYAHAYSVPLQDERLQRLGHDNGITVFTHFNVVEFRTVKIHNRNCVRATVGMNDNPVDIFAVYLDDVSEKTRIVQMGALMNNIQQGRKTIIAGDLNCISDADAGGVRRALKQSLDSLPPVQQARFFSVQEKLTPRGVIPFVESQGFVDTALRHQSTVPTKKLNRLYRPFLRLDYVFATPDIAVISSKVLRNELYDRTSDHYPLVVEFQV